MAVKVDKAKCAGCGACEEVCPVKAIKVKDDKAVVSKECIECGVCVNECPNQAISFPK
ncbi:MAG: 4Fe-4S binding protein [Candidatus Omnitrophota bacterium]|jgi:NAD-dependent dihydropyrimidine dehydrogenase PreA subunit